jgi:hypothetical protein
MRHSGNGSRSDNKQQLTGFTHTSSIVVLRRDPTAREWLAAARHRASDAPSAIRALLAGRTRLEVTTAEAEQALAWAKQLPGWNDDARPALFIYSPGDVLVGS